MNGRLVSGDVNTLAYYFGIASCLGVLFALILPDSDTPFLAVLMQWQLQSNIPMAMMLVSLVLINRLALISNDKGWLKILISGLIGSTLFVPFAFALDILLGETLDEPIWLALADEWTGVVPPVVICWLAVNTPWLVGFSLNKTTDIKSITTDKEKHNNVPTHTEHSDELTSSENGFLRQLLKSRKGEALYVKAELHYVSIIREKGKDLLLYSLKDLAKEVPTSVGIPVHRSYWVMLSGIDFYEAKGRQGELHMLNGDRIPVSRAHKAKMESVWTEVATKKQKFE